MLTRRQVLGSGIGAAVAAQGLGGRADAAPITLRIGHDSATTNPVHIRMLQAADAIKTKTSGNVVVNVYPNSQLGAGSEMLSPVRTGAIDGYLAAASLLGTLAPSAGITALGYAFRGYEHAWASLDGKLGQEIRADIGKAGLYPMDKIWDIGIRHTATHTVPVNKLGDLRGLKIRVAVSPVSVALWKALGAAPTSMNYSEIYSALQTRLVDGMEGPVIHHLSSKFYEVTKYFALTAHQWEGLWLILNPQSWQRAASYQDIMREEFNAAGVRIRKDMVDGEKAGLADLESKGMTILRPDPAEFAARLKEAKYYDIWKDKFRPDLWAEFEKAQAA